MCQNKKEPSLMVEASNMSSMAGYDAQSKGYKLYNPSNGKMVVSCDVEFDDGMLKKQKFMIFFFSYIEDEGEY